jgi:hypothetical protein
MATARVSRGRQTEQLVADYVRRIWPNAQRVAASLPGADILNTPPFAFEVKARRAFNPKEWLKQAKKNAKPGHAPVVIMRPDGMGEASIGEWPIFMAFEDYMMYVEYIVLMGEQRNEWMDRAIEAGWQPAELSDRTDS